MSNATDARMPSASAVSASNVAPSSRVDQDRDDVVASVEQKHGQVAVAAPDRARTDACARPYDTRAMSQERPSLATPWTHTAGRGNARGRRGLDRYGSPAGSTGGAITAR